MNDNASPLPPLSRTVTASHDEIKEIAPDPKGAQIAWVTDSVSNRLEDPRQLFATGLKGTEQQLYAINAEHAILLPGIPGTYSGIDSGLHARELLVKHSTLTEPVQVYVAADPL